MKMRQQLQQLMKLFSHDETLLRLLYYKPLNYNDSPLDSSKGNILDMSNKWDIIDNLIRFTPTFDGLDTEPTCRLFFYSSNRNPNNYNYLMSNQDIKIDIFTHKDYNDEDLRLSWICDHVNDLLFGKHVAGIGKIRLDRGQELPAPENYVGYQLIYEFGDYK